MIEELRLTDANASTVPSLDGERTPDGSSSQPSAERWLTAYAYYYNYLGSRQILDNQPPVEVASLS